MCPLDGPGRDEQVKEAALQVNVSRSGDTIADEIRGDAFALCSGRFPDQIENFARDVLFFFFRRGEFEIDKFGPGQWDRFPGSFAAQHPAQSAGAAFCRQSRPKWLTGNPFSGAGD